ncbi:glycosyltransferase [Bifidobacterium catenulatum]|uniref:glycosyltransferase n=1 Tax=Bifidobacterium catenulatum TaxID=1686 RepID=UPI003D3271FD
MKKKSSNPKISVIMSVYNETVDELSSSIDSIIKQTYQNIEFIIVDDNPKNKNIKTVVHKIKDPRIKFIENKKNVGLVQSLNKAISQATGCFIARMDADDISKRNRLEDELHYVERNKLDVVGSFLEIIDENGVVRKESMNFPTTASHVKFFMRWGSCLAHPTWLVRREVYQKLNGYRNIPSCEDYDFILRAIAHGYKVGNIPKVELSYRIRQSGVSKSHESQQFLLRDYLARNRKRIDLLTEESIAKFLESREFQKQLKQLSHYKKLKQILKKESGIKKIKAVAEIPGNRFFWRDIVEKITLILRECI